MRYIRIKEASQKNWLKSTDDGKNVKAFFLIDHFFSTLVRNVADLNDYKSALRFFAICSGCKIIAM